MTDEDKNASLADRCEQILTLTDGLEERLQPYVDMYGEYVVASGLGKGTSFWNYPGPLANIDYSVRWGWSNERELTFEGTDSQRDTHTFEMPLSFIRDNAEKAVELILRQKAKEEADRAENIRRDQANRAAAKEQRRYQYEKLKKEFEDS